MKKLLSILILFLIIIACKKAPKFEAKNNETTTVVSTNSQLEQGTKVQKKTSPKSEQTIQQFLEKLKIAIKDNNTDYIESCLSFPFEHKSGGELVDSYNSFKEIKANGELFNKIENANYLKDCNYEIENIKHYCISYFDDTLDVTFYAVKKDNQFRLVRMETPN
jgi:hypothetical protein